LGSRCGTLRAGNCKRSQLPRLHIADDGRKIGEHQRYLAADEIVDGRSFAAIGDVHHPNAGDR
jgi:hypothetical protein